MTMENIFIRLNSTYAPNGAFPAQSNSVPDEKGRTTVIGYDAAVCLELYEPWIVEVYNCTVAFPKTTQIVDKAAQINDMNTKQVNEKRIGKPVSDPRVKWALNSTNMGPA